MLGILFAIIGYSIFCMKKDSDHPAWYQHPWTLFWTLPFSIHQKLKAPTVWDLAEVPDKTSVEICKTQKPLHFLAGLGHQPFHHCFNLCWVRSQPPVPQKAEKRDSRGVELTLFSFDKKPLLQQVAQHQSYMFQMFCTGPAKDQNIDTILLSQSSLYCQA